MTRSVFAFISMFVSLILLLGSLDAFQGGPLLPLLLTAGFLASLGTLIVVLLSNKSAALFPRLICGSHAFRDHIRERLSEDCEKARQSNAERRFEEALTILDGILDEDPNYPEALCLKAQVLWESLGNSAAAKVYLRKVMQLVPTDDALHRRASRLYDEVTGIDRLRQSCLASGND